MKLPNFLIIGAAKSGTTSMARYLEQHPEIFFCPTKEPNYFALAGQTLPPSGPVPPKILYQLCYSYSETDYKNYLGLFAGVQQEKAVGEASVRYLYFPNAAPRICATLPNARLVAILREPVSRLYSHYCMNVQNQMEPLPLMEALSMEKERISAGWGWDWHYVNVSLYAKQLKRYYDLFPRDHIKVILYDDFLARPVAVFQEICRHIGVDDRIIPDMSYRGKPAYRPKNLALDRWLHWPRSIIPGPFRYIPRRFPKPLMTKLKKWNSVPVPKLEPAVREELSPLFREDVKELEELLQRKTSWYA